MSFQNEEDEEDLSPNLSSEEFDELTSTRNYKQEMYNSLNEQNTLNKKNQQKDMYKIFSQSTNDIRENKNKIFKELNFGYVNNNINIAESNDNNNIETANFFQEDMNIKNNNENDLQNNNNQKIETYINKPIYENKNINMEKPNNNMSQNYQSFLAEILNLIHQNFNEEEKKEINESDNKEKQQNNNDYYQYENFSKKDIMNYYFNVNNKIDNINQDEKKYIIEKNNNIIDNNNNDIKGKNISIQKNDIKISVNSNSKMNNINNINNIESNNKQIIDISNISEVQANINDSNPNKSKINNILKNSMSALNIENINQIDSLKKSLINNISGFNTTKNPNERNLSLEHKRSVDTLESVNIRRMDEEEAGRKIIIEDEYKKLSLLEKEKMKLIEEEKMIRRKILEEIERQEDVKKKKEMRRIKYFEKVKKKEEDEKKLKDIKLKQEKELKEIYELKNKKKLEEEKLLMIKEGKLKLNNQEINNYKNTLQYESNNLSDFNKEELIPKENIENKIQIISNNNELHMNYDFENRNFRKSFNSDSEYNIKKEEKLNNKIKVNQILNPSIKSDNEKEILSNDNISLFPSLSSFSNKNSSINLKTTRNNIDKYDNKKSNLKHLISFSPLLKDENLKDATDIRINKYMTNNPKGENWNLVDINVNDFYENKKKKCMRRKRTENNFNYNTNVYSNKKVFEKLMDNIDSYNQNKANKENKDLNEVNKIQEITTKAKNEIDKTINAINNLNKKVKTIDYNTENITINRNSTIFENPYLKYGKKRLKQKKENHNVKSNKFNFNLNSRNFNGYFSDNYEKINPHKSFKDNTLN